MFFRLMTLISVKKSSLAESRRHANPSPLGLKRILYLEMQLKAVIGVAVSLNIWFFEYLSGVKCHGA